MVASSIPGRAALSSNNLRQVVHTHVHLSPSSIKWYRSKGDDALLAGKVTVGLVSRWPCHRL